MPASSPALSALGRRLTALGVHGILHYADAVGVVALFKAISGPPAHVGFWVLVAIAAALLRARWRGVVLHRLGHWLR